jgi:aminopeptidase C
MSHAYSLIGAYELKETNGQVVHRLYRVRNPWGKDWGYYSGYWNDKSSLWTDSFKAQVPYAREDDGIFFIDDIDFL